MLIRAAPLLHTLNQFRVVWAMGSFGSGKTLSAFEIAASLYDTGRYRYILGNVNSVWTDNPETVVLRDGSFVDAIVILDEGGLFMRLSRDADAFLLGLRKLNITIIVPSVLPPSQRIKALQIQRTLNLSAFGLPLWIYEYRLALGSERERFYYGCYKPQQLYGIYDTLDYPVDDCFLSSWFDFWMRTAKASRPEWVTWGPPPGYTEEGERIGQKNTRAARQDRDLEDVGRLIEEVIDGQGEIGEFISLSSNRESIARNRKRR